ncbi:conserved hypothetical protein [Candidatus Zixiibacteriota bacterium]|nr:conserved hypothetical protein [candidate division Zixibacteria bacterium]
MSEENSDLDKKFVNHLNGESSPYLLAHANNPVNWHPWGKEALEKARSEDKPIFLSIGYAACHWCHVMEEESFKNEEIAKILNDNFVSIKVDREQRPDIDQIYMTATTAMTGAGGWPLSVFLTPELKPFFAGTYFPPEDRYGRPGFKHVITELAASYKTEREGLDEMADKVVSAIRESLKPLNESATLDKSATAHAIRSLVNNYDPVYGGLGHAPKFPHPVEMSFMLKYAAINGDDNVNQIVEKTLLSMSRGGIYDQIGGGFHRYSTDARWLVPHFEKMLYDNALLAVTYAEAYTISKNEIYLKIVRETLDFILRELADPAGGFYSSLDADSGGEEGKFYVWKKREIEAILGKKSEDFCRYYNIADDGNFEDGSNIPNLDTSSDIYIERAGHNRAEFLKAVEESRQILFDVRERRVHPATDDKILASWNGLAISAFCRGYQVTREERYRAAALRAFEFIKESLYKDADLVHSRRQGKASGGPLLEDYAYLSRSIIDLYDTVFDFSLIDTAGKLADSAVEKFMDMDGNFFLAPENLEEYYIRPRDIADGALPAPGSVMIDTLIRLAALTGKKHLQEFAEKGLKAISSTIAQLPHAMTSAIAALDLLISDRMELVLVGEDGRDRFVNEIYDRFIPHQILVVSSRGEENIPLLSGRAGDGPVTAYICRNSVCRLPVTNLDDFRRELTQL